MENTFEITFRFTAPFDMKQAEMMAEDLMDEFPDNVAVSVHRVPDEPGEGGPNATAGTQPDVATPPDQHLVLEHGLMDKYVAMLAKPDGLEQEHLHQHRQQVKANGKQDHEHEGMTL